MPFPFQPVRFRLFCSTIGIFNSGYNFVEQFHLIFSSFLIKTYIAELELLEFIINCILVWCLLEALSANKFNWNTSFNININFHLLTFSLNSKIMKFLTLTNRFNSTDRKTFSRGGDIQGSLMTRCTRKRTRSRATRVMRDTCQTMLGLKRARSQART